jgi:hypothetical protein
MVNEAVQASPEFRTLYHSTQDEITKEDVIRPVPNHNRGDKLQSLLHEMGDEKYLELSSPREVADAMKLRLKEVAMANVSPVMLCSNSRTSLSQRIFKEISNHSNPG